MVKQTFEIWKTCFETYEISNEGRCRRRLKNGKVRILDGSVSNRGYRYFQLQRNGRRINTMFHHLVARHFIGERPSDLVIDHIDRNKQNNHCSNLRYVTQRENVINSHRYRIDLPADPNERKRQLNREYRERVKKTA
jgi:hypothetical protein